MAYCTRCSCKLNETARFCPNCGLAKVQFEQNNARPANEAMIVNRPESVPEDIRRLLWFVDGPLCNYRNEGDRKIDIGGVTINFSFSFNTEPSAISIQEPIRMPSNPEEITRPPYYPSYGRLTPEQRWIYLKWLTNIDTKVDIGYVFIFYYGLERHLFFGYYQNAYNVVLRLRSLNDNRSFLSYSSQALIAACIIHNRPDLFAHLIDNEDKYGELSISGLYLLAMWHLGLGLQTRHIMALASDVGFKNRRYLVDQRELFENELKSILDSEFKDGKVGLRNFSLERCPTCTEIISANYSLDTSRRTVNVPDLRKHPDLAKLIFDLLQRAHNSVKFKLRDIKNAGFKPLPSKPQQMATKTPDSVFKKSKLFDEIDVTMFDRNVGCFDEAVCPCCCQRLVKVPARKGKCHFCGINIFQKNSVFTGQKLLMTLDEANRMSEIYHERARRKWILEVISSQDLNIDEIAVAVDKNEQIEVALLNATLHKIDEHVAAMNYGFARNSMLTCGDISERLGDKLKALRYYLSVCFVDLNGPENGKMGFRLEGAFLAPGVLSYIIDIMGVLDIDLEHLEDEFLNSARTHTIPGMSLTPEGGWARLRKAIQDMGKESK